MLNWTTSPVPCTTKTADLGKLNMVEIMQTRYRFAPSNSHWVELTAPQTVSGRSLVGLRRGKLGCPKRGAQRLSNQGIVNQRDPRWWCYDLNKTQLNLNHMAIMVIWINDLAQMKDKSSVRNVQLILAISIQKPTWIRSPLGGLVMKNSARFCWVFRVFSRYLKKSVHWRQTLYVNVRHPSQWQCPRHPAVVGGTSNTTLLHTCVGDHTMGGARKDLACTNVNKQSLVVEISPLFSAVKQTIFY